MTDRESAITGLQTAIGLTAERGQKIVSLRIEHADAILTMLKEQAKLKFFVDENGKITPLPVVFPNCPLKEYETVVRCKDCRHCTFSDGEQLADCMIKQGWFPVKPEWFCADGEK